jgi:mannosyltransferase OCH1-like enzyme
LELTAKNKHNFEPKLLNVYDSLSLKVKRNLFKYCILYLNGGIYMDINLEINGELINIISQLLLSNNNNLILTKYKNYISNKLIIASKGLPIFKQLIDSYLNNNILSLTELINNYNNNNNIKFYIDKNTIKMIDNDQLCFYIK